MMEEVFQFTIARAFAKNAHGLARVGRVRSRTATFETPNYVATTSRGVIPHISPDNLEAHTNIQGLYVPLEDFIEQHKPTKPAPFLSYAPSRQDTSATKAFLGLPENKLVILGARRTPPVSTPITNTNSDIAVCTSVGFQKLPASEYVDIVKALQPEMVVAVGDVPPVGYTAGWRRLDKMFSRTERWMKEITEAKHDTDHESGGTVPGLRSAIFAPIMPVSSEHQRWYLDLLSDDLRESLSGLAIYDTDTALDIPEALFDLARLSLAEPKTPQQLLRGVSLGIDIFTAPFINDATDAGIALDFKFPASKRSLSEESIRVALGLDMWGTEHSINMRPMVDGCQCLGCRTQSRAYVQHLLSAKEMLAWVLLQLHNLHVMDLFFADIRKSIEDGTFEREYDLFERYYEHEMPEKTGKGPRVRGYQFKSEGPNEPKKNEPAFRAFDKVDNTTTDPAESAPGADMLATDLQRQGLGEITKE
ncbi:MAG: hypothetical protein M1831_002354 [Alyxoria varia]|nr:MAG: hypothetical protein M1831_002354 [Alyxoria varia]